MLHTPPQQSGPCVQASPSCKQNEEATEHRPFTHNREQQSELCEQALPDVAQAVLSGVHVPPPQVPLQHCEPAEHD
jgi:hypothetical protein